MTLDRGSLIASVSVHVLGFALMLAVSIFREDEVLYEVVSVQIYSPPPEPAPPEPEDEPAPPEPEDELVVETPDPEPPAEEPEPEPPPVEPEPEPEPEEPEPEPEPEPVPEEPEVPDPPAEDPPPDAPPPPPDEIPSEEAETPPEAEEREDAEEGGLDVNVRQEAFSRDYPEYYENVVVQMRRCFRPPSETREATVSFSIRRDGTTAEIGMARRSGSFVFDLAAQEAAECVGKSGRLGPLPDEYPLERLPILFRFSPKRR